MEPKRIIIKDVNVTCDVCKSTRKITLIRYRCSKDNCELYDEKEHTKECVGCKALAGIIVEDNGCDYCEVG